jgi:RHS repeat-associated protein
MDDKQAQQATAQIGSLPGFNGERQDPVLGGYHLGNGYRMYNPALRRFTSPDSMSPFGAGGINSYSYCAGDPINHTDPSGHALTDQILEFLTEFATTFTSSEERAEEGGGELAGEHRINPVTHTTEDLPDEPIPAKKSRVGVASPVPGTSGTGIQQSVVRVDFVTQLVQRNAKFYTDIGESWREFMAALPERRQLHSIWLGYNDMVTTHARTSGRFFHYGVKGRAGLWDLIFNPVTKAKYNWPLIPPEGYTSVSQTGWVDALRQYGYKVARWDTKTLEPILKNNRSGLKNYIQWYEEKPYVMYAREFAGL